MRKRSIIAFLLYSLPILFFIVSFFVMTVSGEDIHQGAGNYSNGMSVNIASDAQDAFEHNGRLTDVYAWTVIDFFDYQFRFGPDTVFRLMDVLMASGIFYLICLIVLKHKPQMIVRDALIFDAAFAMTMITQHGRVFYAGFSAIHNYMMAIFIMLVFCVPYLMDLWGKRIETKWWMVVLMLCLGVVFGMSMAIPPIAFVIVWGVNEIIEYKKHKKIVLWRLSGLIGVMVGMFISNFLGPSLDFYTSNDIYVSTYDYLSLNEFWDSPISGIWRIIKHLAMNFGRVLVPLWCFGVLVLVLTKDARQALRKKYWSEMDAERKRVLLVSGCFETLCVLGASQVNAPLRVLLPAYMIGVIVLLMIIEPCVSKANILRWMIVLIAGGVLITRLILAVNYHAKAEVVLDEIRRSDNEELCIDVERVRSFNFPVVYLGQEDMLVDWAMPENVYRKTVIFCE